MNTKRSYLDQLNAGRQRRPYASLDQLNRSLETLERRIDENRAEPAPPRMPHTRDTDYPTGFERGLDERRYQSIARDAEKMPEQETGIAAFGKLSGELKALREELSREMMLGVRREFETLRKDIKLNQTADSVAAPEILGDEIERLSGAIQSLAEKSGDKSVNMLRLEIEQMKTSLDTLAREETVLSVDRRVDTLEHRIAADEGAAQPGLAAIARRLEEISDAVRNLPKSLALPSLEEKVRMLASALEHFIGQQGGHKSETFGLIEERLDEISRAIVASTVEAQSSRLDSEPFERIEARIAALARQIEEVADDRPAAGAVIERLNLLSERVDDMAVRAAMPEQSIEKLSQQIALIADRIERAPQSPASDTIIAGLEQRFDLLFSMLERRQGEALDQGNLLFRELERRLDEVADRLDVQNSGGLDGATLMSGIDARFSELVRTLDARSSDISAIAGIETRLDDISARLETSAQRTAGIDPELVRNLEAQVATLSAHLATPATPLAPIEDLGPRLSEIEKAIAVSRESVVEAARDAAETAVRSVAATQTGSEGFPELTRELKTLESLARRSDERNGKTFEAIHDTLLKIVDRMASLEHETVAALGSLRPQAAPPPAKMTLKETPSIDPDGSMPVEGPAPNVEAAAAQGKPGKADLTPAQAAAAAAIAALDQGGEPEPASGGRVRSMLGGLTRAFGGRPAARTPALAGSPAEAAPVAAAPEVVLDAPLDPKIANRPLEPGSGAPDLNAIMKRVRDERGQPVRHSETDAAKSDFIAAARRAAQAAAAEADALKRGSDLKGPVKALRIGDLLKSRRKPILMATAAMAVTLAGLQIGKAFIDDATPTADADIAPVSARQPVQTASLDAMMPLDVVDKNKPVAAKPAPAKPAPAKPVRVAKSAPASAPAKTAKPASSEPDKVASIDPTNSTVPAKSVPPAKPSAPVAKSPPAPAMPAAKLNVPAATGPAPLREAASAGDAKALFEVASRYADGRGVAADKAEAAKWYAKSAELGFAPAQFRIGSFYEKGFGVERDIAKAKDLYLKAAGQGNASAMHNLAVLYAMGAGETSDNKAAARWFVAAAELGVKDSQFNLGILAVKGVGMPQSLEESYKWFALVAEAGDKDAAAKRDEIAGSLRPEQLERARAATELWKPKPLVQAANSVDIPESWQDAPKTTASVDMKQAVQNIQLILGKNGYEVGNPDGVMGARTKSAIAAFQKDNGLDPTGEVNEQLVAELLKRK